MFEELIEKIKALDMGAREFHPYEKWTWIDAIEAVVEAINASEPPELDAPDSEGWWWHESLMGHIACYYVDKYDNEDGLFAYTVNGMTPVESFMGKWVKAITPKEAK